MCNYLKPTSKPDIRNIHQVIVILVRTLDSQNIYQDEDDLWSDILAATVSMVQITYRPMLQATPGYIVFGHGIILETSFISYWGDIRRHEQQLIKKNQNKNKNHKPHNYIT